VKGFIRGARCSSPAAKASRNCPGLVTQIWPVRQGIRLGHGKALDRSPLIHFLFQETTMTIKLGDRLPEATFRVMKDVKPADLTVS
jgi:hypothetical protein